MDETIEKIKNAGDGNKLRTFKLYKNSYCVEPYLCCTEDTKIIHAIAQFRLSSHTLNIEYDWYTHPVTPVHQWKCNYCSMEVVEDELHFLIVCPLYENLQHKLFSVCCLYIHNFMPLSKLDKFICILTTRNKSILVSLGKYLIKTGIVRKTPLSS